MTNKTFALLILVLGAVISVAGRGFCLENRVAWPENLFASKTTFQMGEKISPAAPILSCSSQDRPRGHMDVPTKKPYKNKYLWQGWIFQLAAKNPSSEKKEKRTLELLQSLISTYDLSPWVLTKEIHIEHGVASHSNPLTINTRHNDDSDSLLSTFLHEQIHRLEMKYPVAFQKAMNEVKGIYHDDLPRQFWSNRRAAYRHFIVIYFEIKAIKQLLGDVRAQAVIDHKDKNEWIYQTIVADMESFTRMYRKYKFYIH